MPNTTGLTIGVDLGGTNIQAGLVDPDNQVLTRDSTKTKAHEGQDTVIKRLCKLVESIAEEGNVKISDIDAIGIGAPGAIDFDTGTVITAVNLRWNNVPLESILEDYFKRPVIVDNDVNVGAWGEYKAGAGKGQGNQFAIFVGTGIGGGLILNDRIFHGPSGTAGEIGQTIINSNGDLGRNTLEQLASRTAVADSIAKLIRSNRPSLVTDLTGGDLTKIRSKVLSQAYAAEDPLVCQVLDEAAVHVGHAAANIVTVLSLPCIVLGGGLVEAIDKRWIKQVRQAFDNAVFPKTLRTSTIVASLLGDDAGVVGAARLAGDCKSRSKV